MQRSSMLSAFRCMRCARSSARSSASARSGARQRFPRSCWKVARTSRPRWARRASRCGTRPKRATTSLLSWYEGEDAEPLPQVGDLSVVLDGSDTPLCVIRTTTVEIRPFGEVDEAFAWVEGEGDRSLAHWREAHIAFFASEGRPVDEDTPLVLDTFELLWPSEDGGTR